MLMQERAKGGRGRETPFAPPMKAVVLSLLESIALGSHYRPVRALKQLAEEGKG